MNITYGEALKEIRKKARDIGLTFKRSDAKVNNAQLWRFVDRESGRVVIDNTMIWTAYSDCMSGYIKTYNKQTGNFN